MKNHDQQDARHRELVRAYYETDDNNLLAPVLNELRPRLEGFLWSKNLRNSALLADIVQDTLAAALTDLHRRQYAGTGTVASWVMEIGWHSYCQHLRRKANHITQPGASDDPFRLLALPAEADELPDAEEEAQAVDQLKKAAEYVLRLDKDVGVVVKMHYFHCQPVAEAARLLGISPQVYGTRLSQGNALLKSWGKTQPTPTAGIWAAVRHVDTGPLFRQWDIDG